MGAWVSIWLIFILLLDPPVPNGTWLAAPSDSEAPAEQGQCFRIASESRGCEHALPTYLTQEMCCCTVGKAWGSHCERCPQMGTGEDRETETGQFPFSATLHLHRSSFEARLDFFLSF